MRSLRHRAPSGWCRSPHPAARRSRDWCVPAGAISPAIRRVRRPAAIDPPPVPGSGQPTRSRHGRLRAAARPRFPRPATPGTQMRSTPPFPLPAGAETFAHAANPHQPPHFRRNFIMTQVDHSGMANAIRGLAMDAVEKAKSGHPGLPMGAADIATVLFTQFLKFDAADPRWPNRDRFILSAGPASMLLYALLYLTGNPYLTLNQLKQFR